MTETAPTTTQGDYFAAPGLSYSGMKDLAVSTLRFWHLHLNPERPPEDPTPAMHFGSALHCAVLEPGEFDKRYACEPSIADYPGCLVTMDDLRSWCQSHGLPSSGKCKADLVGRVAQADPNVPIWDAIKLQADLDNANRVTFSRADWDRIRKCADSLLSEPRIQAILAEGRPEVAMTATDPETGVLLKARMDWVAPGCTMDLKTFTQQRGKSIDKSITDAIWYERYHWQTYHYGTIRTLQPGAGKGEGPTARSRAVPRFVMAFVESEEPFETRIRELRPMNGGGVSMLWERARYDVRELVRLYARCMEHFGPEKPWRYAQEVEPLCDEEISQLAFSR
jgi:hypothetical protein